MNNMFLGSTKKLIQIPSFCLVHRELNSSLSTVNAPLSENDHVGKEFYNRNPRNLERLRIAWRPQGYHLEAKGREYWHKLVLTHSARNLTAQVVHYTGKVFIEASTKDWAIRKQLYKNTDTAAYENLAHIFLQRCLESGLTEMYSGYESTAPDTKIAKFIKILEEGGISLTEPARYLPAYPWDQFRPEKPWEVQE